MSSLRILLTNNTLGQRAGSELYVRDLALALLARGHTPIAFSTVLGAVAQELRQATVPVIDDLNALGAPPDIIHGQHHLETMMALLHFPGTPAINICHGWAPWEEAPPIFPRIRRYLAVDDVCRDRLVCEHGIPTERVQVLLNFVDLDRFKTRAPLPPWPQRALVFSNDVHESNGLGPVRESCAQAGIALDVIGLQAGSVAPEPEAVLGSYDLIFAKGRSALEALAVGATVILFSPAGLGPLVTMAEVARLRRLNFGSRTLRAPLTPDTLNRQIARYDATDAAAVSAYIRATASRQTVVDELLKIYRAVITEHASGGAPDWAAEECAAADYLRWLAPRLAEIYQLRSEHDWMTGSFTFRLRNKLLHWPLLAQAWRAVRRQGGSRQAKKVAGLTCGPDAVQSRAQSAQAHLDEHADAGHSHLSA